jgi:hypothetical protein
MKNRASRRLSVRAQYWPEGEGKGDAGRGDAAGRDGDAWTVKTVKTVISHFVFKHYSIIIPL